MTMTSAAARRAPVPEPGGDPAAGRKALEDIRETMRRLELLADQRPEDRLFAAAVLRAAEATAAAEEVAGRQVPVELVRQDGYDEGWAACEAAHAARRRHLHPV